MMTDKADKLLCTRMKINGVIDTNAGAVLVTSLHTWVSINYKNHKFWRLNYLRCFLMPSVGVARGTSFSQIIGHAVFEQALNIIPHRWIQI